MSDWREAFEDAKRLFFLSVGISNSGGRKFKPELAQVVAGEGWRLENSTATVVDHEGKWALRLAPDPGPGVAWLADRNFSTGKIDFRLAAVEQQAGLLLQPLPIGEADHFGFAFSFSDAGIDLRVWLESNGERQDSQHLFPLKMRGEWIPMRIVVTRELLCLFVDGDHVPALKSVHGHRDERPARLGVWRGPAAEVLLTDLKLIETDEWNLK